MRGVHAYPWDDGRVASHSRGGPTWTPVGQQPVEQVAWSDGRSLRDGIGQLFEEHSTDLLAWFQSRTFSGQVAADLCAETFAVALEQAARFDPARGTSGAWL